MLRCLVFVLFFLCAEAQGQVVLSKFPKNLQLYPRDKVTNKGLVTISGYSYSGNSIKIELYRNGTFYASYATSPDAGTGFFQSLINIVAERANYTFTIYETVAGIDVQVATAGNIVAGDVYIIQGQSNSVAAPTVGLADFAYQDSFVRSFGTSIYIGAATIADNEWYIASGDNVYTSAAVGQWGLVMGKQLSQNFNIPVAILNGGHGGQPITFFQRNDASPEDVNTNYGRVLYRAREAEVADNVTSILFYQGESDGADAQLHDSLFKRLYNSWRKDYKTMVRNYMVQVRDGCGGPTLELREKQRQMQFFFNNFTTLVSNGISGHDGCHFTFANGYELLGKNVAGLLSRDIYKQQATNIEPVNVKRAFYSNAAQTEITLELYNETDSFMATPGFYKYFFVNNGLAGFVGGFIRNNKIVLQLSDANCGIKTISYNGGAGAIEWVTNKKGIGMLSFLDVPIVKARVNPGRHACPNSFVSLGVDNIPGYTYLWTSGKWSSSQANPVVKVDSIRTYQLVVQTANLACPYDTFRVKITTSYSPVAKLKDTTICYTDSLLLPKVAEGQPLQWTINGTTSNGEVYVKPPAFIKLKVANSQNCVFTDTFNLSKQYLPISLTYDSAVCEGSQALITANTGYKEYRWDSILGTPSFLSGPGIVALQTIDSLGCSYFDTATMQTFANNKPAAQTHLQICDGSGYNFVLSLGYTQYSWNGVLSTNQYYITKERKVVYTVTDANSCTYTDSVTVQHNPLPVFSLGSDFKICKGNTALLVGPPSMAKYSWLGASSTARQATVGQGGNYILEVEDSNACTYSDTITVGLNPLPADFLPADTVFCEGDTITVMPFRNFALYNWATGEKTAGVTTDKPGIYKLTVTDSLGCWGSDTITLTTKNCTVASGISARQKDAISVWPNPHNGTVSIKTSDVIKNIVVVDVLGKEINGIYVVNPNNGIFTIGPLPEQPVILRVHTTTGIYTFKLLGGK